jgi:hypothetical protein
MVCGICHQSLGSATLDVGSTGEFKVPSPETIAAVAADTPGESPDATGVCAWCAKPEAKVKKLIGRQGTSLCNECVSLACDIMDAELGSTWR